MKSATVDAIRKLETIIEVYDTVPDGWFTLGQYRGVVNTSLTAAQNRLDKAVREGRAERRMIRLTGRRPCWIYRARDASASEPAANLRRRASR